MSEIKNPEINPGLIIADVHDTPTDELLSKILKKRILPTIEVPKPPVALMQVINGMESILATLGNFSVVIGKAKSRKSFFISMITATILTDRLQYGMFKGCLTNDKRKVLYFDTEQGNYHVYRVVKRICDQLGITDHPDLEVYALRDLNTSDRLAGIERLIEQTQNLGFVIIDGIRDLVSSINDESEATEINDWLLRLTAQYNIHIVTVLHQNKNDSNARGHLGTELINKAETTLSVTKHPKDNNISIVEPEYCRNIEPEKFAITVVDGLPQITDIPADKNNKFDVFALPPITQFRIFEDVLPAGKELTHGELLIALKLAIKERHGETIGDNKVKDFISHGRTQGYIIQNGNRQPYRIGTFKID